MVPQPLPHPDLDSIPAAEDCGAIFEAIAATLPSGSSTLLDMGALWELPLSPLRRHRLRLLCGGTGAPSTVPAWKTPARRLQPAFLRRRRMADTARAAAERGLHGRAGAGSRTSTPSFPKAPKHSSRPWRGRTLHYHLPASPSTLPAVSSPAGRLGPAAKPSQLRRFMVAAGYSRQSMVARRQACRY